MASRPAQLDSEKLDAKLATPHDAEPLATGGTAKSGTPGRASQKKRQRERHNVEISASRRQKLEEQQAGKMENTSKITEAVQAQQLPEKSNEQKVARKRKKKSKQEARSKNDSVLVPEQKPALKPTANQRKKARKRARQQSSSKEALSTIQEAQRGGSAAQAKEFNSIKEASITKGTLLASKPSKGPGKATGGLGHHKIPQNGKTPDSWSQKLPADATILAPPSRGDLTCSRKA